MNALLNSLINFDNEDARTANGAKTLKSSLCKNLDLFFVAGASRNNDIVPLFSKAYAESSELALRIAAWTRDARGGAGERKTFRDILNWLIEQGHFNDATRLVAKIPELGRWDDILITAGTPVWDTAVEMIRKALNEGNGLCAKWMPRKGAVAVTLRNSLGMTPKQYRKTLVGLSDTVEQKMCAQRWDEIDYGKLPSVAFARSKAAFSRHDQIGFSNFLTSVQKGEAKINAGAVFPHDILRGLKYGAGDVRASTEQWKALPNYMEGSDENILVMADVSGSMGFGVSGLVTALDVCISLAIYCSERMGGAFKDYFLTFSGEPTLQHLTGDLNSRYNQLQRAHWGMNTNLQAAFDMVLEHATRNKVPASDMPTKLLIMSDMEFDACVTTDRSDFCNMHGRVNDNTNYAEIARKFEYAGYKMPQIVFWNLNGRSGNVPVKMNQAGVALVSGYSPSILKNLLNGSLDPLTVMLDTISNSRYNL